jgi:hypothetical protein
METKLKMGLISLVIGIILVGLAVWSLTTLRTCDQKCKSLDYTLGVCRGGALIPPFKYCMEDEVDIGSTYDCRVEPRVEGVAKRCCCK